METETRIFGRAWSEIKEMQSGSYTKRTVPPFDANKHREDILRDMERFKIPVHEDVAAFHRIEFPRDYELVGDTWVCTAKKGES